MVGFESLLLQQRRSLLFAGSGCPYAIISFPRKCSYTQTPDIIKLVGDHGAHAVVLVSLAGGHLHHLRRALLEDLLDHLILILRVEVSRQSALGSGIIGSLSALLVGYEDAETGYEVCQRDALVAQPLLVKVGVVDENDEVLAVTLVTLEVNLGLGSLASSHFGGVGR